MIFTSFNFLYFSTFVLSCYWLLRDYKHQNLLLLLASYIFYGFTHPAFSLLLFATTMIDFYCGGKIGRQVKNQKYFLFAAITGNLTILGFFKYFNFFTENVSAALKLMGLQISTPLLHVVLPAGISFFILRSMSYTIDVYQGRIKHTDDFASYALFVAFFPQLLAGPIERAGDLLPQFRRQRLWKNEYFLTGSTLLLQGYLKKLVIADNVSLYADKVFMLDTPSAVILVVGTIAFSVQIYADFSAYTDIARGIGVLLGFQLSENFCSPYIAITPSDFWRRWHITLSQWIRDYIYIPLGGSRVRSKIRYLFVLLTTMGLCGLWHGAAWNYILWGLYHGLMLFLYSLFGFGGKWRPNNLLSGLVAWGVMINLTMFGWFLFRVPDLTFVIRSLQNFSWGLDPGTLTVGMTILTFTFFYTVPFFIIKGLKRMPQTTICSAGIHVALLVCIIVFHQSDPQDFYYFRF